jgi:hypothetical protein
MIKRLLLTHDEEIGIIHDKEIAIHVSMAISLSCVNNIDANPFLVQSVTKS